MSPEPRAGLLEILWRLLRPLVTFVAFLPALRLRHLRAMARLRRVAREPAPVSPLSEVSEGVHRVDAAWVTRAAGLEGEPADGRGEPLVIHFLGTGETLHGPLPALAKWLAHEPDLARCAHFLVDSPLALRDYAGLIALQRRAWSTVEPLLDHGAPAFVFVGMSRGGVIALESAARAIEEKQAVATCVAASPPVVVPRRFVPLIRCLAGFERTAEWADEFPPESPGGKRLRRLLTPLIRRGQRFFVGYTHAELGIDDAETLRFMAHDLSLTPPFELAQRQVGEYGMLVRMSRDELRRYSRSLVRRLAESPRANTTILFGSRDTWIDVDACRALLEECVARVDGEEGGPFTIATLEGHAHTVGRAVDQEQAQFASALLEAYRAATALAHEAACRRRAQDRLESYLCPPSAEQPITRKVDV